MRGHLGVQYLAQGQFGIQVWMTEDQTVDLLVGGRPLGHSRPFYVTCQQTVAYQHLTGHIRFNSVSMHLCHLLVLACHILCSVKPLSQKPVSCEVHWGPGMTTIGQRVRSMQESNDVAWSTEDILYECLIDAVIFNVL